MQFMRIDPEAEKAFRKALGYAARGEIQELEQHLEALVDSQVTVSLSLCGLVTGYVCIDACGREWPDEENLRKISYQAANVGSTVRKLGLQTQVAYDFIARVAVRGEELAQVFPDPEEMVVLPFVLTASILGSYRHAEQEWWEFLNKIEGALEAAEVADLDLLPGLMLRSRGSRSAPAL